MKRASSTVFSVAISALVVSLALSGCSRATNEDSCKQITEFNASLTEKADKYWEEDHPKNGGSGDYSRSEALIVEADQLIVDNPTCFAQEELALATGRLKENAPQAAAPKAVAPTVNPPKAKTSKPQAPAKVNIFDQPAQDYLLASGINSLLAVWGILLNDSSGPKTLGEVSDEILEYLNANAAGAGDLTQEDLLLSLQPGNSLNSMVYRLFENQAVIDAVVARWLSYLP
jgi:ABC-type enterochelin transport system substrate-binding protein